MYDEQYLNRVIYAPALIESFYAKCIYIVYYFACVSIFLVYI